MKGYSNPTIRSTEDGEIVGPKMHAAVQLVASGPSLSDADVYPCMNPLAKSVGPNGSQQYGYNIIKRCRRKNLVAIHPGHDDATPRGDGAVVLTDKGARYLNQTEEMDLDPDDYVDASAWWSRVNEEWR